ncbi:hypothetical protein PTTG_26973 [Puccinia triticina 1-1 BBBD Race 1]|uniref:Uncharacterized protein n=2 Tax=Puccinia triticina TaxID=208348 RepID=A0A180GPY1_PUCT1|nr:uncharacterized protein PtA15_12A387 [Puccinia triticina]OAV94488.1 hypothetical protein PTTG_26973 [Puccinia triticina 1-1 BBBD Race 1]WAQ90398.1 hypothetical protein PtA15_12A387 [Puccinia triticina]WAR61714.1 hypothetical protein PtB15_12B404 [Puccinia triticina]
MGYVCAAPYHGDSSVTLEEKQVERRQLGETDKHPHHIRGLLVKRKGRSKSGGDLKGKAVFTATILGKLTTKIDLQFKDLDEMVAGKQKFDTSIINRRIDTIIRVQNRASGAREKIGAGFPQVKDTITKVTADQATYLKDIDQRTFRDEKDPKQFAQTLDKIKQTRKKVVDADQILMDATKGR